MSHTELYAKYYRLRSQYRILKRQENKAIRDGVPTQAFRNGLKVISDELKPIQRAVLRIEANKPLGND